MLSVQDACAALHAEREDELCVLTMSAIAFWPDRRADDYRLLGLMGGAASIGLGLALGCPDRGVWVLDGDGSLLMQLGALSAIGDAAPARLVHVVLANGIYAVSGAQPTPGETDWTALFLGAGYADAVTCRSAEEIPGALRRADRGPLGLAIACTGERPAYPPGMFGFSAAAEAQRLRDALAG